MIYQTKFEGYTYVGLLGVANDKVCILPNFVYSEQGKKILEVLKVEKIIRTTLANSFLLGLFCSLNNRAILLPDIVDEKEIERLESSGMKVVVLKESFTALGNLILMNDYGCVISKYLRDKREYLEKELEIPVEITSLPFPGVCGICNNKGCLMLNVPKEEREKIEDALNVEVRDSLYLEDYPKIKTIANSFGAIISKTCLPKETAEICDSLRIPLK